MEKYERLKKIVKEMKSVLVAFSGGVDSTLVLKAASDVLGDKALAVTAKSIIRPSAELARAEKIAAFFGVKHIIVEFDDLRDAKVAGNVNDRCYYCKKNIFTELKKVAVCNGFKFVVEGSNIDDAGMYRPGRLAINELGIRSPLEEAGLTKQDVRYISKMLGLDTWDLPSQSCFLTRFPYDTKIGEDEVRKVEQAEKVLIDMGFKEVRVRGYPEEARVEVASGQVFSLQEEKTKNLVIDRLKSLGYNEVTIDPSGYRTGSMDE